MTWKTRLVLLFAKLRKPLNNDSNNIALLRKKSEKAAKIGYQLFDKKVTVANIINTNADGVPVRIYKDSDASNQPVIVYYHGGGFVLYGLDSHDNVCRRLCMMNRCLVVSVAYRLAPEHTLAETLLLRFNLTFTADDNNFRTHFYFNFFGFQFQLTADFNVTDMHATLCFNFFAHSRKI
jgi:acetyl esterase/lipase